MAIEIKVPDIGVDEVEIIKTLVKMGDKTEVEQSLTTIEGDKASMGVPSPQVGIVREIKASVGDKTQTGTPTMIFDSTDGAVDAAPIQAEEKKETAPAAVSAAAAARDANIPDIGSDGVKVTEILVKVGDKVEAEQPLITIEDDKASMEVPAPFAGTVKEIKANVGDKVSTGPLIMIFEVASKADAVAPAVKQEAAPVTAPASTADVKEANVPGIGGDEVEVIKVMVKVGDKIAVGQSLITVEDDKASMEVPASFTGVVKKLKANIGDKVETDSLIMIFEVEGVAPVAVPAKQEATAPAPTVKAEIPAAASAVKTGGKSEFIENDAYVHVTPPTRCLAHEFGVNLAKMKGTGRKGRILCEDVQAYMRKATKCVETAPMVTGGDVPGMLPWPKVGFSKFDEVERAELGHIQKISGTNLSRN